MELLRSELAHARDQWWILLVLGICLQVLGLIAVGSTLIATLATVVLFGILILAGGIAQIVGAFSVGRWSGFLIHLLLGILYVVTGFLLIDEPLEGAMLLTLLLAAMLIVGGVFRIVASLTIRFPHWGWQLLSGLISVLLGVMIYKGFPQTGLVVIGLFVGIELILDGLAWIMLSVAIRRLPVESEPKL